MFIDAVSVVYFERDETHLFLYFEVNMELSKNIETILRNIPKDVRVVAATKYATPEDMKKLLQVGIHHFGENRTDAFLEKYTILQNEVIHWHFIGHLQVNKAKEVLPKIEVLHSLDSLKLAAAIEKTCSKPLDCFIEVNVNQEESKNGISVKDCEAFLTALKSYSKVHVIGLMMMTTKESSREEKRLQFQKLKALLDEMNQKLGTHFKELSMGMSEDYQEAIEAGTTTVRLGRILWDQMK